MKEKGFFAAIRAFFVYSGDEAESNLTGVARYLQEYIETDPEAEENLDSGTVTGVARYLQENTEAEPAPEPEVSSEAVLHAEAVTGVARYLEQSDSTEMCSETVEESIAILDVEDAENAVELVEEQELELVTGVAKYMEEQAVIESELPLVTGVEMYLQDQVAAEFSTTASTGVGEYLDQANAQSEAAAIIAKYQAQDEVEVQEEPVNISSVANYITENILNNERDAGATGVSYYLDKEAKIAEAEVIIANFLERQTAIQEADVAKPSSVATYIDNIEKATNEDKGSGVDAYLEKSVTQAEITDIIASYLERVRLAKEQQEALKPQEDRVSVVKIRNRKPSGVALYISRSGLDEITEPMDLSGVGKYMMDQGAEAKEQESAEIIARYQARQDALLTGQKMISGVARYILNLPEPGLVSSVDKYLVNRPESVIEEVPGTKSSVSMYLDERESEYEEALPASGVARYLANQLIAASKAPVEKISGVDRYVLSQNF